jgi:UDP-N-acetylglucosamine 2-epimerase (non-hydrolysing)
VLTLDRRLERLYAFGRVPLAAGPVLATMHRYENVGDPHRMELFVAALARLAAGSKLLFVTYRRTRRALDRRGLLPLLEEAGIELRDTLPYDDYVRALVEAPFVVTDSSGLQDDCAFLQKPCLVLRDATPRVELAGKFMSVVPPEGWGDLAARLPEPRTDEHERDLNKKGKEYDQSFAAWIAQIPSVR